MHKILLALGLSMMLSSTALAADTYVIAAFGDSLMAGPDLKPGDVFAVQLEQKLIHDGYPNVKVMNDAVIGDTTADGLARVQSVILQHPKLVVIELGTNDLAKGIAPVDIKKNLDEIMDRFSRAHISMFLTGRRAPASVAPEYAEAFNAIFPDLAKSYGAVYYPNFLEGADGILGFMQQDGIHPTRVGVSVIVGGIANKIEYDLKK